MARAHEHKQQGSAKRDLPSETHCKLRSTAKKPQAAWFREAGPTIRNPLQAAKHRSCGYERPPPPQTVPRSGTDISTMILRTVHRSRFAEPKECVSVLPTAALLRSLQWVSDRYVSHRDTAQLILSYSNGVLSF